MTSEFNQSSFDATQASQTTSHQVASIIAITKAESTVGMAAHASESAHEPATNPHGSGADDYPRIAAVLAALRANGWSIATAESLTGGLICAALTSVPGASDVVRGSIVAYTAQTKAALLSVPTALIEHHGVYSNETVEAMALGAKHAFQSEVAVACSGVAGPGPDGTVPPGKVLIATVSPAGNRVASFQFAGNREDVRAATVSAAIDLLAGTLNLG